MQTSIATLSHSPGTETRRYNTRSACAQRTQSAAPSPAPCSKCGRTAPLEAETVASHTPRAKRRRTSLEPDDTQRNLEHWVNMQRFLARRRSRPTLSRSSSSASVSASIDPETGEKREVRDKRNDYSKAQYEEMLAQKGSFLRDSSSGPSDESRDLCARLLHTPQQIPQNTLFDEDKREKILQVIHNRSERMIIELIGKYIMPSAQALAISGMIHGEHLAETIDETWDCSILFEGPLPKPDYSVGFKPSAFTAEQQKRLEPFLGGVYDVSWYKATSKVWFPFFSGEVKRASGSLDEADRQNSHSATISLRGLVTLFRCVGREVELHRKILFCSLSHNDTTIRLYGHFAEIDGDATQFFRRTLRRYDYSEPDGMDTWTAYKFCLNVYQDLATQNHQLICSVIPNLPDKSTTNQPSFAQRASTLSQSQHAAFPDDDQSQESQECITPPTSESTPTKVKRFRN